MSNVVGHSVSRVTRDKIRASLKGHPVSEETRQRISTSKKGTVSWNRGRSPSESTRAKLREANIGKIPTEETRKKISEANKGHHHNLGRIPTAETVRKRGDALKGHPVSEETRKKISDGHKGKILSEETKRRIGMVGKRRFSDPLEVMKYVEMGIGGFWYGNVRYYGGPQYCEKFDNDLKERVRAYWGYACFECGTPQNGSTLHVHHVHYNKKACCDGSPRDMIPLCTSCHAKTNKNRPYWEKYFTDLIYAIDPLGKCYFTPEEMTALNPQNPFSAT